MTSSFSSLAIVHFPNLKSALDATLAHVWCYFWGTSLTWLINALTKYQTISSVDELCPDMQKNPKKTNNNRGCWSFFGVGGAERRTSRIKCSATSQKNSLSRFSVTLSATWIIRPISHNTMSSQPACITAVLGHFTRLQTANLRNYGFSHTRDASLFLGISALFKLLNYCKIIHVN